MSKIIKLPHLQEVILDLVDKIKLRFNQTVVAVDFDENTNIVTVSKGDGQTTTEFSLDKFVDEWGDLDCVTEYPYANLFDYAERMDDKKYEPDGSVITDTGTSSVIIEILGGNEYSIFRQHNDNHNIVFYDAADQFVDADTVQAPTGGGWHKKVVNAPANAAKMAVNFRKDGPNSPNMMVIKGDVINNVATHIPYLDGGRISIGDCVSLSFNNDGTTLASTTHVSAIKELAEKITTVAEGSVVTIEGQKPDAQGNIDLTFEKIRDEAILSVNTHEVGRIDLTTYVKNANLTVTGGTQAEIGKVPQLNKDGKVDITLIPDLSFNKVHSVQTQVEAEQLIQDGTAKVGDTIVVRDTGSVYLYINEQGNNFQDQTLEIAFGTGTVKTVNNQAANPQGNVTVNANQIYLEAEPLVTIETKLKTKLISINRETGVDGNVDLSLAVDGDELQLKVENNAKSTLSFYTDAEANALIAQFV